MQKKEYEKKKAEVENAVNYIEDIDTKIAELEQEKLKISSEYHVELLEHDLRTVKKVEHILKNLLTEKATESVEDSDVLGVIEEVISDIKEELKEVEKIRS